jgi:hypothetical protein
MADGYSIYTILTTTIGLGCVGYFTYSFAKNKISQYVAEQVIKKVNEISNSEEVKFKQFQKHPSAIVIFDHGGKSHNLCIPFDQSKAKHMRRRDVYLIRGTEKIEITHKPGVPYLISAKDMGGDKIVVEKDGIILKEYIVSELPKYLEDIDD